MGWKLERIELSGYEHQIKPNEEKDIFIELEEEKRAAIHGEVKFPNGKPVKDAVVKLFIKEKEHDNSPSYKLIPITFTFTDEFGQFLFGVESKKDYVIKVFYYKPERPLPKSAPEENSDYKLI